LVKYSVYDWSLILDTKLIQW